MKRSTKALLLSALAFPGAGHLLLKSYLRGALLAIVSVVSLCYVVFHVVQRTMAICEMIIADEIPLDMAAITEMVTKSAGADTLLVNIASYAIGIAWVVGIVDSYRIGRKMEQESICRTEGQ